MSFRSAATLKAPFWFDWVHNNQFGINFSNPFPIETQIRSSQLFEEFNKPKLKAPKIVVTPDNLVSIESEVGSTVFCTTDGSDPRLQEAEY